MLKLSLHAELIARFDKVAKSKDRAQFENFRHASHRISQDAKSLIIKRVNASQPGMPPHTRGQGGHNLRGAIRFAYNKISAIIGPIYSFVGVSGAAHEFGGMFRGYNYKPRPFMLPALNHNLDRIAIGWQHSIGE